MSHTPGGQGVPRLGRARLEAAPQPLHERVDAAHRDERVAAPDLREQRLAAEDDAGVRREQMEEPELLIRELDVAAVDAHAPACRIDRDAVHGHRLALVPYLIDRALPRAAQTPPGPRNPRAHAERTRP